MTDLVLAWENGKKVIRPPIEGEPNYVPPVPDEVSRFQAKAALATAGLLASVETAVAASADAFLQLAWSEALVFKRNSPAIAAIASVIGMTDAEIDALFIQAKEIAA